MFDFSDTSFVLDIGNLLATVILSVAGIIISVLQMRSEKREKKKSEEIAQKENESVKKLKDAISLQNDIAEMSSKQQILQSKLAFLYSSLNVVDFYNTVRYFSENDLNELIKIDKVFDCLLGNDLPKNSKYFSALQSQIVFNLYNEYRSNCHPEMVNLQNKTLYLIDKLNKKISDFKNDNISVEDKSSIFFDLITLFEDVLKHFNTCNSKYNSMINSLYFFEKTF